MWNDVKKFFEELSSAISGTITGLAVLGFIMWYTSHLIFVCNGAGCLVTFK